MEDWVKEIVDVARKKSNILLKAKLLKGNYYLYRSTSRYVRTIKKTIEFSEYLGRIKRENNLEREGYQIHIRIWQFRPGLFIVSRYDYKIAQIFP